MNFKEWMVKSILVRAEHRDAEMKRLQSIIRQLDFCHVCNCFIGYETYESNLCEECGKLTCDRCKTDDICNKCNIVTCIYCAENFPEPDMECCDNCCMLICKECYVSRKYCSDECFHGMEDDECNNCGVLQIAPAVSTCKECNHTLCDKCVCKNCNI